MLAIVNNVPAGRKRRRRIDDAAFVAALDLIDFRDAPTIARLMLQAGNPATLPVIRKRMVDFVREGGVEANGAGGWRIENGTLQPPTNDNTPAAIPAGLLNRIHTADGVAFMAQLPDQSVDMVLVDPPYTTCRTLHDGHRIDELLDLPAMWEQLRRIITPSGVIAMFATDPLTQLLMRDNVDIYKYRIIWEKTVSTGSERASSQPMRIWEEILLFSFGKIKKDGYGPKPRMTYNPWRAKKTSVENQERRQRCHQRNGRTQARQESYVALRDCPTTLLRYAKDSAEYRKKTGKKSHPFMKPQALLDDLIRMFSNESDVVLDFCCGSGATAVAAMKAGRDFIGVEKFDTIAEQAREWLEIERQKIKPPLDQKLTINPSIVGEATIYNCDVLDGLRLLPDNSVDLVFTSPPYNLRYRRKKNTGNWKSKLLQEGYECHGDDMADSDYVDWQKEVLRECWRVLTPTGAIYYNHKARVVGNALLEPSRLNPDLPLRQIVTWDRGTGINASPTFYRPSCEQILIFAKPDFRLRDRSASAVGDVWRIAAESSANTHPAPFPVALAKRAIETTNARVILDPFMGSGSTGVAALELGRAFIGIENGPVTAARAIERITSASEGYPNPLYPRSLFHPEIGTCDPRITEM